MRLRWITACWSLGLALVAPSSFAHGLDAYRIELVSYGHEVELVATPPVSYLAAADRDGDGRISRAELAARRPWVLDVLTRSIVVQTMDGASPLRVERADVSVPHTHDDAAGGEPFVRWTVVLRFARAAAPLRVRCDFATTHAVSLWASRASPSPVAGQRALSGAAEGAVLTASADTATLFARSAASEARAQTTAGENRERAPTRRKRAWPEAVVGLIAALATAAALSRRPEADRDASTNASNDRTTS
jgi:hypothetical protein